MTATKKTRIAIVGSRDFPQVKAPFIRECMDKLTEKYPGYVLVSGGAAGVDTWAEFYAGVLGLVKDIYRPDWKQLGRRAGLLRNQVIVQNSDLVIAFWNGISRGTLSTIASAFVQKRPCWIMMPDESRWKAKEHLFYVTSGIQAYPSGEFSSYHRVNFGDWPMDVQPNNSNYEEYSEQIYKEDEARMASVKALGGNMLIIDDPYTSEPYDVQKSVQMWSKILAEQQPDLWPMPKREVAAVASIRPTPQVLPLLERPERQRRIRLID